MNCKYTFARNNFTENVLLLLSPFTVVIIIIIAFASVRHVRSGNNAATCMRVYVNMLYVYGAGGGIRISILCIIMYYTTAVHNINAVRRRFACDVRGRCERTARVVAPAPNNIPDDDNN